MIAKFIALSLIPAGAATLGVVAYLQHAPRAVAVQAELAHQSPVARFVAEHPALPPAADEPEVVISPMVVKPPAAKPRVQKKPEKEIAPCSGWRPLGFEHVENGKASGVSKVRELCDPNAKVQD